MNRFSMGFLALLLVSTPDLDAQTEDGFYVELDAGLSLVSDHTTVKFDGGANFGGALGYRFLHHYRGEVNISTRNADVDTVGGVAGFGDLKVTVFMANVYYDFDLGSSLEPYLGVGAGVGTDELNYATDPMDPFPLGFNGGDLAWNLMVGASYRIHEGIDLSFGYRYLGVLEVFNDNLKIHEFLMGVRYHF